MIWILNTQPKSVVVIIRTRGPGKEGMEGARRKRFAQALKNASTFTLVSSSNRSLEALKETHFLGRCMYTLERKVEEMFSQNFSQPFLCSLHEEMQTSRKFFPRLRNFKASMNSQSIFNWMRNDEEPIWGMSSSERRESLDARDTERLNVQQLAVLALLMLLNFLLFHVFPLRNSSSWDKVHHVTGERKMARKRDGNNEFH